MIAEYQYHAAALGRSVAFSLHMPDTEPPTGNWPLLVLLHGLGRTHRTVVDHPGCWAMVSSLPFAVLLPDGEDGWYCDATHSPTHRYQSLIHELVAHVRGTQPVSSQPDRLGIAGWSMGGFGAMRYAESYCDEVTAVASIIGLLDFPNPDLPPEFNHSVPPVLSLNADNGQVDNPLRGVACLRGKHICIVAARDAFDILMNRNFHAALDRMAIQHAYKEVSGGHEWPVVEAALPTVFAFMNNIWSKA